MLLVWISKETQTSHINVFQRDTTAFLVQKLRLQRSRPIWPETTFYFFAKSHFGLSKKCAAINFEKEMKYVRMKKK